MLCQLQELNGKDIGLVKKCPNKQCTLDPIPTSLLKSAIDVLAPTGGSVAERLKPLASKQEWNCRAWVRIPLMPRFHMPLIPTPPRVSTGLAHFSIMWQGSPDIALMQLKGT